MRLANLTNFSEWVHDYMPHACLSLLTLHTFIILWIIISYIYVSLWIYIYNYVALRPWVCSSNLNEKPEVKMLKRVMVNRVSLVCCGMRVLWIMGQWINYYECTGFPTQLEIWPSLHVVSICRNAVKTSELDLGHQVRNCCTACHNTQGTPSGLNQGEI